jgi:hypothetical protein
MLREILEGRPGVLCERLMPQSCLGREFTVGGFDDGLIELRAGDVFEQEAGKHRIWLAEDHLTVVV